jgi:hypothetical protein
MSKSDTDKLAAVFVTDSSSRETGKENVDIDTMWTQIVALRLLLQKIIEDNEKILKDIKDALQTRKSGVYYWFKN